VTLLLLLLLLLLPTAAAAAATADYHPNKHERMKAVFKYYLQKDLTALAGFPGGSEPGS
jgi:hypothetical protein